MTEATFLHAAVSDSFLQNRLYLKIVIEFKLAAGLSSFSATRNLKSVCSLTIPGCYWKQIIAFEIHSAIW